jgi:hypothetical protein
MQLVFDIFAMALHRLHTQTQQLCDVPCAKSRAEQLENLHLAIGQVFKRMTRARPMLIFRAQLE